MTEQLKQHWPWIVGVALPLVLHILQKVTTRWDDYKGPNWRKLVLLLIEALTVLTSAKYRTTAGHLKLPLTLTSGRRVDPENGTTDNLRKGGSALVILAVLSGCAGWADTTRQSLRFVHESAKITYSQMRPIFVQRCEAVAHSCHSKGDSACAQLLQCQNHRDDIVTAFASVHTAVSAALLAIDAAELATDEDKEARQQRAKDLAKRASEVLERVILLITGGMEDGSPIANASRDCRCNAACGKRLAALREYYGRPTRPHGQ